MDLLNPLNDFVFKYILGTEQNKLALIEFINAVFKGREKVTDLRLLNPLNPKTHEVDKRSILDIKAQLSDGRTINVEIQVRSQPYMDRRILYYWAKLFTEFLRESEDYERLNKTISIVVVNYEWFKDERYHHRFHIMEDEDATIPFTNMLEIHVAEVAKAAKKKGDKTEETDELLMWLLFLNDPENPEVQRYMNKKEGMNQAMKTLVQMSQDYVLRDEAESREKWVRDQRTMEKYTREKALEEGREKGREEGREEGIEKGIKKGREEVKNTIARNLLSLGTDKTVISKVTGMSIEEIESLNPS